MARHALPLVLALLSAACGAPGRSPQAGPAGTTTPERHGARGDGVTDDTAALQAAFDSHARVELRAGATYLVRNLVVPATPHWTLEGRGATLKKAPGGDPHYLLASARYLANRPEAQPPVWIRDLRLDAAGVAAHALVHQSWSGEVADVEAWGATSHGILLTAETRDGTPFPESTLVNTRWRGLRVHHNGGHGFYARDRRHRNRVTDGYLEGSYLYANAGYGVRLDAGAGWKVTVNTYGNGGGVVLGTAGLGTRVTSCYLDDGRGPELAEPLPTGERHSYAFFVETHILAGQVTLADSTVTGPVGASGRGTHPPAMVRSLGNTFHAAGHRQGYLYNPSHEADRVLVSVGDTFETTAPFRSPPGAPAAPRFAVRQAWVQPLGRFLEGEQP